MIRYATRLPPNTATRLLSNGRVRKTEYFSQESSLEYMVALLEHLIHHPDPLIVPVYDYAILQKKRQDHIISYDMMRCGILEEDERMFVDYVGEAWDMHGQDLWKRLDQGTCMKYPEELRYFRDEQKELASFLTEVIHQNRYQDLHSGNVMRDEDNNFVLIDLEGFIRTPLEADYNSWITR